MVIRVDRVGIKICSAVSEAWQTAITVAPIERGKMDEEVYLSNHAWFK